MRSALQARRRISGGLGTRERLNPSYINAEHLYVFTCIASQYSRRVCRDTKWYGSMHADARSPLSACSTNSKWCADVSDSAHRALSLARRLWDKLVHVRARSPARICCRLRSP
eukprot:6208233-Pleurochrysis_carterae.AAC.1